MANFDSGVSGYIKTQATVTVKFPVDFKNSSAVACKFCRFLTHTTQKCVITGEIVPFPEKYVGMECPLENKEETK